MLKARSSQFAAIVVAWLAGIGGALAMPYVDPRFESQEANPAFIAEARDPACSASTLVSTGGAFPRHPRTLAIRWTGYANFRPAKYGSLKCSNNL